MLHLQIPATHSLLPHLYFASFRALFLFSFGIFRFFLKKYRCYYILPRTLMTFIYLKLKFCIQQSKNKYYYEMILFYR